MLSFLGVGGLSDSYIKQRCICVDELTDEENLEVVVQIYYHA